MRVSGRRRHGALSKDQALSHRMCWGTHESHVAVDMQPDILMFSWGLSSQGLLLLIPSPNLCFFNRFVMNCEHLCWNWCSQVSCADYPARAPWRPLLGRCVSYTAQNLDCWALLHC
jgi:hypothetical protein